MKNRLDPVIKRLAEIEAVVVDGVALSRLTELVIAWDDLEYLDRGEPVPPRSEIRIQGARDWLREQGIDSLRGFMKAVDAQVEIILRGGDQAAQEPGSDATPVVDEVDPPAQDAGHAE